MKTSQVVCLVPFYTLAGRQGCIGSKNIPKFENLCLMRFISRIIDNLAYLVMGVEKSIVRASRCSNRIPGRYTAISQVIR